jgi:hypothetical protein
MLDDMFKIFLDPYFKRREYTWNDLYPTEEATKEFLSGRLVQKIIFSRPKPMKSVNRSPSKDHEVRKSLAIKDDSSIQKFVKPITLSLYSGYSSKQKPEFRKKKRDSTKSPRITHNDPSKTETKLPQIQNSSHEKMAVNFASRQFANHNE